MVHNIHASQIRRRKADVHRHSPADRSLQVPPSARSLLTVSLPLRPPRKRRWSRLRPLHRLDRLLLLLTVLSWRLFSTRLYHLALRCPILSTSLVSTRTPTRIGSCQLARRFQHSGTVAFLPCLEHLTKGWYAALDWRSAHQEPWMRQPGLLIRPAKLGLYVSAGAIHRSCDHPIAAAGKLLSLPLGSFAPPQDHLQLRPSRSYRLSWQLTGRLAGI